MIIDAHFHSGLNGWSLADLNNYIAKEKINYCWLLTWEDEYSTDPSYQCISIEETLEWCKRSTGRIIPFYSPDPRRTMAVEKMREYKEKGCRGCGELKVSVKWTDKCLDEYLHGLTELNWPLVFHMQAERRYSYTGYYLRKWGYRMVHSEPGRQYIEKICRFIDSKLAFLFSDKLPARYFDGYLNDFEGLEIRLREYRDLIFIAHGPLFWSAFEKSCRPGEEGGVSSLLDRNPNLFADISARSAFMAIVRNTDIAGDFLERFSDRILYGTDNRRFGLRELITSLSLSSTAVNNILGENAARIVEPIVSF